MTGEKGRTVVERKEVEPQSEGVFGRLEGPTVTIGAISPKAVDDVAVEEVRAAGPLELTGVAAVILKAEGEQAIEIAE